MNFKLVFGLWSLVVLLGVSKEIPKVRNWRQVLALLIVLLLYTVVGGAELTIFGWILQERLEVGFTLLLGGS